MRGVLIIALLAGCTEKPPEITVHTGRPFVAAIDRGDGWEVLPDQEDLVLEVGGPFAIASVCGVVGALRVQVWLVTAADEDEWYLPCRQAVEEDLFAVQVRMAPGTLGETRVSMGDTWRWLEDDVPMSIGLRPGLTDRLAVEQEGEHRFVLERRVEITEPGEWVIDLDRDGRPLEQIPVIHNVLPEDAQGRINTWIRIWTDGIFLDRHDFDAEGDVVHVLPADVLEETDAQLVFAHYEWSQFQSAWVSDVAGAATFVAEFPALLDDVTFTTRGGMPMASYDDDRDWPERRLGAFASGRSWSLTARQGWVEAAGEDRVVAFPDVTTIPGWQPGWELGPSFNAGVHLSTDPTVMPVSGIDYSGASSP